MKAKEQKIKSLTLFEGKILRQAVVDAFVKLNPLHMMRRPVMFVVEAGSVLTSMLFLHSLFGQAEESPGFILAVSIWLWFTVLGNFAEAMAEGRGKAQARALRSSRRDVSAKRLTGPDPGAERTLVAGSQLHRGDFVLVEAGDVIPGDGEVVVGIASVDESAITGESAPVIRESGGDRSAVTGGTRVLSDWVIVRVTSSPGETFLDRMIAMVEGRSGRRRPTRSPSTSSWPASRSSSFWPRSRCCLSRYSASRRPARGRRSPSPCSSPCSSASSRRPSAGSSRPSALPAWTG